MKKLKFLKLILLSISTFIFSTQALAQKPMASPRDSVKGKVGTSEIHINYGSPSVKGRVIWGDLVPYGKVWRTGANEATRFSTSKDIMIEGKKLEAGTYSFFAIPNEKEWIIIFNRTAKQWGAFDYKQNDDALRVTVHPVKSSTNNERLIYKIHSGGFSLLWENLEIPVKIN